MALNRSADATTQAMKQRWSRFAEELATASPPSGATGELIVLGSGIAHADVMVADEAVIRNADHVFHCLYDRVTQAWIAELRPDALDLRILYDPAFPRHDTYVCMAEAMLHHVRRGRRVAAIYYGHPGVFATPTHRAIAIARSEGHHARMRPGISALDHLIADVGFDPMIPGLLSYEASDLLLRNRRLDPTLHTVIWQVGTVGEFGFAPLGFENRGFDLLVDRLTAAYGERAEVTHYLAPQYAGIDPLVQPISLAELRSTTGRAGVNALSTFYIAPTRVAGTDPEYARALGHDVPATGQDEQTYDPAAYGPGEAAALGRFADFHPPDHYTLTARTPATDFILALARRPEFLARYRDDPAAAIARWDGAPLSDRARRLMEIPHPRAFNAAIAEPAAGDE